MYATKKQVRGIRGVQSRQHGFVARGKKRYVCDDLGVRKSDMDVTTGGFSLSARRWHKFTKGGEPICDVCKRVGHVARNCWQKNTSLMSRRKNREEKDTGLVVHSVVKNRSGCPTAERHIAVSVLERKVDALLDFNAMENAVSFEIVQVDPKLRIYEIQDTVGASKWKTGVLGMVWLPVVIGSRSDKLRCVVVKDLSEELVIGLPGLSFLGASINFATGDVRISRRRRKNGNTMAKESDELLKGQALVRDVMLDSTKSENKKSPDVRREKCTKDLSLMSVKGLVGMEKISHDVGRVKGKHEKPNQKKDNPVSGPGRMEGKVNVVPPEQEKHTTTITTTTITRDHSDEKSDGECDSSGEDASEPEEHETRSNGNAKAGKHARKAKHKKKGRKKKGKRNK